MSELGWEEDMEDVFLVADSGSTKTDWRLVGNGNVIDYFSTQGINPYHQDEQEIRNVVNAELANAMSIAGCKLENVKSIRFYGAGCRGEGALTVRKILEGAFAGARNISVESDLMAAAHAVCGTNEGVACILGTGANSCLYDGRCIVANVSPLGYILGDEGSGAVLGKLFLNEMLKGAMPREIRDEYMETTHQTVDDIIRKVYREPMANRWLASISPFIRSHINHQSVSDIVVRNFIDFFRKNVDHYRRKDLPVGAVGSIAYYYREQLELAAEHCGYELGRVLKSPFDGLI